MSAPRTCSQVALSQFHNRQAWSSVRARPGISRYSQMTRLSRPPSAGFVVIVVIAVDRRYSTRERAGAGVHTAALTSALFIFQHSAHTPQPRYGQSPNECIGISAFAECRDIRAFNQRKGHADSPAGAAAGENIGVLLGSRGAPGLYGAIDRRIESQDRG